MLRILVDVLNLAKLPKRLEREREKICFYLHHKSQFSLKRKNKELSQTLQKMLPMKKYRKQQNK